MKNEIILLLDANKEQSWSKDIITFISSKNTQLLSNIAGYYTASDLLIELKIRLKSIEDSSIEFLGIYELMNTLTKTSQEQIIKNYAFKSNKKSCIVYLDDELEKVIGVILITHQTNP